MGADATGTVAGIDPLALVLPGGWAAGVNAYATVLLLGALGRLGLGDVGAPVALGDATRARSAGS